MLSVRYQGGQHFSVRDKEAQDDKKHIFAKQIRLDPAIMAAPLITTIVDTCSIIIFFKIATMVFHL